MRSHLLEGKVRHRRSRPVVYALEHDVYYFALDLVELDEVDRVAPARRAATGATSSSSATTTTGRSRRPTSAPPSSTTCAPRARTPPAGGSRSSRTRGSSATSSTRRASTCAATRPGSCAWWSSRCITRIWSATCTRCDRAPRARASWPRWRRTSTSRRSSTWRASTPCTCRTTRPACASPSTSGRATRRCWRRASSSSADA